MRAGQEHQGAVTSRHTLQRWSFRISAAKTIRAKNDHAHMLKGIGVQMIHVEKAGGAAAGAEVVTAASDQTRFGTRIAAIEIKSDATHELGHLGKLHVSCITTSACNPNWVVHDAAEAPPQNGDDDDPMVGGLTLEDLAGGREPGVLLDRGAAMEHLDQQAVHLGLCPDLVGRSTSTCKNAGDLMEVQHGTGKECYGFHSKELHSVGAPDWEDSKQEAQQARAHAATHTADAIKFMWLVSVTFYCFGTDAGGENIGCFNRVRTALLGCEFVMCVIVFCFMHQGHLIGKDMIKAEAIHMVCCSKI